MTSSDFADLLQKIKAHIIAERERNALLVANDATAMIADRVQRQGLNAQGSTFGTYSPFTQKIKQQTGRTRPPYPNINFTQTAQMWKSIKPIIKASGGQVTSIEIDSTDSTNQAKLEKNVRRFGPILQLSDKEIQMIRQTILMRYRDMFSNFGL